MVLHLRAARGQSNRDTHDRLEDSASPNVIPSNRKVKYRRYGAFHGSKVLCPWVRPWTAAALAAALGVVCYAPSLHGQFVLDDEQAIVRNKDVDSTQPLANIWQNDFWGTPMGSRKGHKSFRPLTVLTFRLNHALHGLHPAGYHAGNVALHAAATVVFALLLEDLGVPPLLPSLLFAAHPVHAEAVANVVGRAELLSGALFFAAILSYARAARARTLPRSGQWAFLAVALSSAAMLAKEPGITALGVCIVYESAFARGLSVHPGTPPVKPGAVLLPAACTRRRLRLAVVALGGATAVLMRLWLNGAAGTPDFAWDQNPASFHPERWVRALSYSYIYARHAWLLVWPAVLSCDWSDVSIPLVTGWTDPRNLASAALYCALIGLAALAACSPSSPITAHRAALAAVGGALLVLPFLPATNLFFRVGFVVAERVLYLPSAGACLGAAAALAALESRLSVGGWTQIMPYRAVHLTLAALAVVTVGAGVLRTARRTADWHDAGTLYTVDTVANPRNPKLWYNLGLHCALTGDMANAEAAYRAALQARPSHLQSLHNLALLFKKTRRMEEAQQLLRQVINTDHEEVMNFRVGLRLNSQRAAAANNLAILLQEQHSAAGPARDEALALLRWALQLAPEDFDTHYNLGLSLLKAGDLDAAREHLQRALAFKTDSSDGSDVLASLGMIAHQEGHLQDALGYYQACLAVRERADVRTNLEKLLQEPRLLL